VLIGTPGRLLDHVRHTKSLQFDKVGWLIVDEADRLFDMGYEKDVARCVQHCIYIAVIMSVYWEVAVTRACTFQFHRGT
jgi:superfamily II DNA/RNA helicase